MENSPAHWTSETDVGKDAMTSPDIDNGGTKQERSNRRRHSTLHHVLMYVIPRNHQDTSIKSHDMMLSMMTAVSS